MKPEDKQLLLTDLCARLPFEVKVKVECTTANGEKIEDNGVLNSIFINEFGTIYVCVDEIEYELEHLKPYLRSMSSMTEDEARDIAILHGYNPVEILSTKVTDEYIDIILDDCAHNTITSTIWYDGIISSLECFDYLNKKMFDFRGLIPKDLALSTEIYNPYIDNLI